MGRIYTVPITGTLTNGNGNYDLFNLQPADDKPIRLRGLKLSNYSEIGDGMEEMLRISIQRFPATVSNGSGGSSPTPAPVRTGDAAAGFTARCLDSTVGTTSGSAVLIEEFGWNIRGTPLELWYPDENFCPYARQTEAIIVRLESTVTDDISFAGVAYVEEV